MRLQHGCRCAVPLLATARRAPSALLLLALVACTQLRVHAQGDAPPPPPPPPSALILITSSGQQDLAAPEQTPAPAPSDAPGGQQGPPPPAALPGPPADYVLPLPSASLEQEQQQEQAQHEEVQSAGGAPRPDGIPVNPGDMPQDLALAAGLAISEGKDPLTAAAEGAGDGLHIGGRSDGIIVSTAEEIKLRESSARSLASQGSLLLVYAAVASAAAAAQWLAGA